MDTVTSSYSVPTLLDRLGSPSAPLIIDVRVPTAFKGDTHLIAGAIWRDPFSVNEWSKYLPRHRPVVVYCVHGLEISRNAADGLCADGVDARPLEGGIAAWRDAGGPLIKKSSSPRIPSRASAPSAWVTRERPKIDRIACPWLIRRFIDPLAVFVYVPSSEVLAYAEQHHATPYDVPGVTFTHRDEACSFDALLADFDLHDGPLDALATIVRGADTGTVGLTAQSPGLLAISLGLSRLYPDDQEMLAHGMTVYDALYAWLKGARNERHNADLFKKA
jgi:rhodanese-related sulfurtransferase